MKTCFAHSLKGQPFFFLPCGDFFPGVFVLLHCRAEQPPQREVGGQSTFCEENSQNKLNFFATGSSSLLQQQIHQQLLQQCLHQSSISLLSPPVTPSFPEIPPPQAPHWPPPSPWGEHKSQCHGRALAWGKGAAVSTVQPSAQMEWCFHIPNQGLLSGEPLPCEALFSSS